MSKTVYAMFRRTVEYPVTVEVPDDVELVWEGGEQWVKVTRERSSYTELISLQVAAGRGLVKVTEDPAK